ncbi:MAG: hypothetical protein ABFD50_08265 [Smithella sp.]
MDTPQWLEAVKQRQETASDMVGGLASGRYNWRMRIPVDREDSDVVLSTSLNDIPALLQLIEKQREALENSLLPEYQQCDGFCCTGCWKDLAKAALNFKPEGVE